MSREHYNETRVYCDGCGFAVVESQADYTDRAIKECGWLVRIHNGRQQELCPVCRPDTPEILVKIREVCSEWGEQQYNPPLPIIADILKVIDGDGSASNGT